MAPPDWFWPKYMKMYHNTYNEFTTMSKVDVHWTYNWYYQFGTKDILRYINSSLVCAFEHM